MYHCHIIACTSRYICMRRSNHQIPNSYFVNRAYSLDQSLKDAAVRLLRMADCRSTKRA